jgi:hypothetical protein
MLLESSFSKTGKAFSFGGVGGRTADVDMIVVLCFWAAGRVSFRVYRLLIFGFLDFFGFQYLDGSEVW